MGYQIKIPSCVYAGVGSIEEIGTILKQESSKKALVFTDKGVAGAGLLDKLTAVLERTGVEYKVFDGLNPEPAYTERMETSSSLSAAAASWTRPSSAPC